MQQSLVLGTAIFPGSSNPQHSLEASSHWVPISTTDLAGAGAALHPVGRRLLPWALKAAWFCMNICMPSCRCCQLWCVCKCDVSAQTLCVQIRGFANMKDQLGKRCSQLLRFSWENRSWNVKRRNEGRGWELLGAQTSLQERIHCAHRATLGVKRGKPSVKCRIFCISLSCSYLGAKFLKHCTAIGRCHAIALLALFSWPLHQGSVSQLPIPVVWYQE